MSTKKITIDEFSGEILRKSRESKGKNQEDVAREVGGLSKGHVSAIELGKRTCSLRLQKDLVDWINAGIIDTDTTKENTEKAKNASGDLVATPNHNFQSGAVPASVVQALTDPDLLAYIDKTVTVLTSGTDMGKALKSSIEAFHRAIEDKRRIDRLEQEVAELQHQIHELAAKKPHKAGNTG